MTRQHERCQERQRADASAALRVTDRADKETPRLSRRALAVLVVAAAALLPAAHAAPLAAPRDPVWIDPCGIHRDAPGALRMKIVKRAVSKFHSYLNDTIIKVSQEWQRVSSVYRELQVDEFPIDMEWLPTNQFSHYKDNVQRMKLPKKLVHFLQHVHDGVQKYLATVVWLQGDEAAASSDLPHKDLVRRTYFLARIRNQLKSLQCAAQKAIVDSQARLLVQKPRLEDLVDSAAFPQPSQGTTQLLLRDRAFLLRLQAFLNDWQLALSNEWKQLEEKAMRRHGHGQKDQQQQQKKNKKKKKKKGQV